MTPYTIIQTEKAYRTQTNNTFVIIFPHSIKQPNKIEVTKLLLGEGFHPIKITKVNQVSKTKIKTSQRRKVSQKRPTKYYVTLPAGEQLKNPEEQTEQN